MEDTFGEVLKWFNEVNLEYISSIPFSFSKDSLLHEKLFSKKKNTSKLNIIANEINQAFSLQQIKEGGFFVVIGRKK